MPRHNTLLFVLRGNCVQSGGSTSEAEWEEGALRQTTLPLSRLRIIIILSLSLVLSFFLPSHDPIYADWASVRRSFSLSLADQAHHFQFQVPKPNIIRNSFAVFPRTSCASSPLSCTSHRKGRGGTNFSLKG